LKEQYKLKHVRNGPTDKELSKKRKPAASDIVRQRAKRPATRSNPTSSPALNSEVEGVKAGQMLVAVCIHKGTASHLVLAESVDGKDGRPAWMYGGVPKMQGVQFIIKNIDP
jgi:hypothetical protein